MMSYLFSHIQQIERWMPPLSYLDISTKSTLNITLWPDLGFEEDKGHGKRKEERRPGKGEK
jgi:hypothetical protein